MFCDLSFASSGLQLVELKMTSHNKSDCTHRSRAQMSCSSTCRGWVDVNWENIQLLMNTLYIQLFVICMDVYTNQKISNAFSIDFHLVSLQKMLKLETGLRSRGAVCPLAEWGEGGEAALFFFLGRVVYWRLF